MTSDIDNFTLESESLCLDASRVTWDSNVLGVPVANITRLDIGKAGKAQQGYDIFKLWVQENNYGMISCRLLHNKLLESGLLERNDFRFIEMMLHPVLTNLQNYPISEHGLSISSVEATEVPLIADIAERVFIYERFHVDPFLDSRFGDTRYRKWVENSYSNEKQHLLKATLNDNILGFFVVEYKDDLVYWHLTAIAPEWHGQGVGSRVWMAMIESHQKKSFNQILTAISARNVPVLNLYSKLNFRFQQPEMTFHWVRDLTYQNSVSKNT